MPSTLITAVVAVLLVAGVIGSLVPFVPGALFSLAGVGAYWWATGFTTPSTLPLVAFVLLALGAIIVDLFGGALAAERGGAGKTTIIAAVVASLVLALVTGPLGILLGIPLTVFLIEYYRTDDREEAGRTAAVTVVGMFASNIVQAMLTGGILVGFALVVWV